MKKLLLLIMICILVVRTQAQETDSVAIKHEFGIHVGSTTGIGLSYRHWFDRAGLQLTMLPLKYDDETFLSVGLTGLYSIYHSEWIRFFGYWANNIQYNRSRDYGYSNRSTTRYNMGFGPGFAFGTKVQFNIMAGYGLYDILDEFNIFPTGEIGLYFRF